MPDDETVAALRDYVAPLSATAPDADAPLTPLEDHLTGADVVGLGEVTHGTRECFELKRRVVRHLVAERGFRTVAFEADVANALGLDTAVRGDDGDPTAALGKLEMWQWQTESVRALLDWLREFNEGRPADDQVRVRGVDLSDPSVPAAPLAGLLRSADVVPVPNDLVTLAASEGPPEGDAAREHYLERAEGATRAVAGRLDDHREAFVDATSDEVWALASHLSAVVVQNCEWHRVRHEHDGPHADGMAARDERMAANVEWCLEQDPGDGVVVWAHNSHVQRGTFDDGQTWTDVETMGEHLDRSLGDRYRPFGFDFGRGSFRAMDATDDDGPTEFSVGAPPARSATADFDALDESACFVDVAAARDDSRVGWDDTQRIRWVGSVYDPDDPDAHYQRTDLADSFDGLFYLAKSTPTRPLDGE